MRIYQGNRGSIQNDSKYLRHADMTGTGIDIVVCSDMSWAYRVMMARRVDLPSSPQPPL